MLHKLRERQANAPAFLLADRELAKGRITIEMAEMVDEFVWPLEDTSNFVAGRIMGGNRGR